MIASVNSCWKISLSAKKKADAGSLCKITPVIRSKFLLFLVLLLYNLKNYRFGKGFGINFKNIAFKV